MTNFNPKKGCLLAVDVGTSACKVMLFDTMGKVLATATEEYKVFYPQMGWAEQNPMDWWNQIKVGIKKVIAESKVDPKTVLGIGVDGQSWSCIPLDKNGEVLYNTPIWMDTRAEDICKEVCLTYGEDTFFDVCGNPFKPSYTTPKILWFKRNFPEIYDNTEYFLQCNSFIVYKLTGKVSQDVCQGYGLHVFNIKTKKYDSKLCDLLDIDINKLPPIYECSDVVGTVTKDVAEEIGLVEGIPVVAGGLDAACGTLGAGVYMDGQTQEQGGQAGGMSMCINSAIAHKSLILSTHVVPGKWLLQGGTVGGGASFNWISRELGGEEEILAKQEGGNKFAMLDKKAEAVNVGSDGLIFLPYLSGERSPLWDPDAKGVYFGLSFDKTKGHFIRSLLEGAAFALNHNLACAKEVGVDTDTLYSMGGAANSRLWTQIKADITGKTICVPASDTATCFGAAILAGVGAGVYDNFKDVIENTIEIKKTYTPNLENHEIYKGYFEIYKQLYVDLKDTMKKHSDVVRKVEKLQK